MYNNTVQCVIAPVVDSIFAKLDSHYADCPCRAVRGQQQGPKILGMCHHVLSASLLRLGNHSNVRPSLDFVAWTTQSLVTANRAHRNVDIMSGR